MNILKIISKIKTEEKAIKYLIKSGILTKEKICYKCKKAMKMNLILKTFICNNRKCLKRISIFKNTFFHTCKIKINKLLMLCYLYLLKTPVDGIKKATGLSSATITDWTHHLRQLLGEAVDEEQTVIGGPGIIVEVDETKMDKRKYNSRGRVEGVWVIVGIERTPEKKIFMVEIPERNKGNITQILSKYIREASIVYTDCWKAYVSACEFLSLIYKTVNHSKGFVNKDDGTHTNTVEGLNKGLKTLIKPRNRNKKNIKYYLMYYIWRRLHSKKIWKGFLDCLKEVKYN